jgi:hypothetical protein
MSMVALKRDRVRDRTIGAESVMSLHRWRRWLPAAGPLAAGADSIERRAREMMATITRLNSRSLDGNRALSLTIHATTATPEARRLMR